MNDITTKRYLRAPDVRRRYGGISDRTLFRWVQEGRAPRPIIIGNARFFDIDELDKADAKRG